MQLRPWHEMYKQCVTKCQLVPLVQQLTAAPFCGVGLIDASGNPEMGSLHKRQRLHAHCRHPTPKVASRRHTCSACLPALAPTCPDTPALYSILKNLFQRTCPNHPCRYLLKAYWKARLAKIERFATAILDNEALRSKCRCACPHVPIQHL